jgi:lipopolysaccharide/colanic/teichoic acid biosynthesis glycosyltransferase
MISRGNSGSEVEMSAAFYSRVGKRGLDVLGSGLGLLLLSPLFLIVAVLVKASSAGPVFFRQVRVGQFQKPFRILKFRSMSASKPGTGGLLTAAGDPRVTSLGRWLRKSKVDELPQLINVFLGEMSLVGPRPEVPEYTAAYTPEQRRVFEQKPGITGPAAIVNVREEELLADQADQHGFYLTVLLPAKLAIDLEYCGSISLAEDLRLIFITFASIFWKPASSRNPVLGFPEKQS